MNLYMYTHTHKIVVQDEVRIVKAKQQWHDPRGINRAITIYPFITI